MRRQVVTIGESVGEGSTYSSDKEVATSNLRLADMQVECLKHKTSNTGLTA
jgi:hypothetical protein